MNTSKAREIAFKVLYEMEVRGAGEHTGSPLQMHIEEEQLGDKASGFVSFIVNGVYENNVRYNDIIKANLKDWKFDRVSKLSLAAIKLALFEIENNDKINENIAIAEAIKLTAKFEGEEAAGFVNGILGSYIRNELERR